MTESRFEHDEEALGRLLAALPAPPETWVEAAASLPKTRQDAERIVALAEEDEQFRAAGYEPTPPLLAEIRMRLEGD
jgi:hypothetical protein